METNEAFPRHAILRRNLPVDKIHSHALPQVFYSEQDQPISMTTRPLNIGIIGVGKIATDVHIPVLRAMENARIAWIADTNRHRLQNVANSNRLKAVAIDPDNIDLPASDVILLAIPLPPRECYFRLLARSGVAVLAEKPLTITAVDHRRLLMEYEPWRLSVCYQRRYYAISRLLRNLISQRPFGMLREIRISEGARMTRSYAGGSYHDAPVAQGGGLTKNLGCHSLDLVLWITQAKRFEILERQVEWDGKTDRAAKARLWLHDIAETPGAGCQVRWQLSSLSNQSNSIELEFENNRLCCSHQPSNKFDLFTSSGNHLAELTLPTGYGASTFAQAFYLQWQEVLRGVTSRGAHVSSAATALMTAELMDELLH